MAIELESPHRTALQAAPPAYPGVTILDESLPAWEISATFSPTDPSKGAILLMAAEREGFLCRAYITSDGGAHWQKAGALPGDPLMPDYWSQGDPVVAFDRAGVLYAAYLMRPMTTYLAARMYVTRSRDGGTTWDPATPYPYRDSGTFDDKEWLAVDTSGGPNDGTLYLGWTRHATNGGVTISTSRDGGLSWSQPQGFGSGNYVYVATGLNGECYLVYSAGGSWLLRKSTDGGTSFSAAKTLAPFRSGSTPTGLRYDATWFETLEIDRSFSVHRGRLYFLCAASESSKSTVLFPVVRHSDDGGATWSDPVVVGNGMVGTHDGTLAVNDRGTVVVSWLDRKEDAAGTTARLYGSVSTDGGATFSIPTPFSSSVSLDGTWIGHYNQNASSEATVIMPFSDAGGYASVVRYVPAARSRAVRKP